MVASAQTGPAGVPRRGRVLRRLPPLIVLLAVLLTGVLVAMAVLVDPALRLAARTLDLPTELPDDVALSALGQRSRVVDASGRLIAVLHDEVDRRVISLEDVPEHVRRAVLAAEDRRFHEHDGYDLMGIARAAVANLRAQEVEQGGSTITQQLAKINFTGGEESLRRKVDELLYAVRLEERFTKDELLERYLNQVYFGAGAYGIRAAAEEFFDRHPRDLTVGQAALLAGLIRAPGTLDPRRAPGAADARRDAIVATMREEGWIGEDAARAAAAEPLAIAPPKQRTINEPHVVEAIKQEFFANPAFGETRDDRIQLLFSGGLEIRTTLELGMQRLAEQVVAEHLPGGDGPTAAIAAVEPGTGRVFALHSGADFGQEQFNFATQGRRQPGSAFKPFVLAAALEQGFPPRLELQGNGPLVLGYPGAPEPWEVDNYGGGDYGTVNFHEATVRSVNTAFAQLVLAVGPEHAVDVAERLGIHMGRATGGKIVPALTLGGFEHGVTPLDMAGAYSAFAAQGRWARPYLIQRVTGPGGDVRFQAQPQATQGLPPDVASAMLPILRDVVARGTGRAASVPGWPVLGKTGTTQNSADAWFAGSTPVMAAAVWVGHPSAQIPMPGVTGGSAPATIWGDFMGRVLGPLEPVPFPDGDHSLAARWAEHRAAVPDVVGMTQSDARMTLLGHRLGASVIRVASAARAGVVVRQSPRPGAELSPGQSALLFVSTGRPPAPPPPPPTPSAPPSDEDEPEERDDRDDRERGDRGRRGNGPPGQRD